MLGKILIFTFCFVGMFGLLMTFLPTEFTPIPQNEITSKIRTELYAGNVIVYNQTAYDNMTYPYQHDWDFALPAPQKLRIDWSIAIAHYTDDWGFPAIHTDKGIWLTHLTDVLWGYWYGYHMLEITYHNGTAVSYDGYVIFREDIVAAWEPDNEWSIFYAQCKDGHISMSIVFERYNTSKTIGENWDDGTIGYKMTYDVDYTKTAFSAWSVVSAMLSFVFPTVVVPGVGGSLINGAIGTVMSIMIGYGIYKLITGLVPFLSGGSGD